MFRLGHASGTDRLYAFVRIGHDGDADLDGDPRPPGAYIVAFDLNGTYQWDHELPFIENIAATPAGVNAAGFFGGDFDFGGRPRNATRPTAYLASYGTDGSYRWDRLIAAEGRIRIRGLARGESLLAATGSFVGDADFGDGYRCSSSGTTDITENAFALIL
ncbi:MAG TPA: hypothetical protein VIL20_22335 [Sandaracinaceae bacterium]